MDRELNTDFYFGDKVGAPIKTMDYSSLKGFKGILRNKQVLNTTFSWQKGAFAQIFKPYDQYIITGEPNILSNWCILIIGRLLGKKVHAWSHGIKGDPETKYKFIAFYFFKLCSTVLLYGNHSRNVMLSQGFSEKKLICIYNSLDYKTQKKVREKLTLTNIFSKKFGNDWPVIIYIGRIQKSKKLEVLAEVTHRLKTKGQNTNLVFIGKNIESENSVQKKVAELGIEDRVWFYGPSYNEEEIGELIFNSDVCVSPGPLGLTALHSMVYGTPVVTNDNFVKQMPEHEAILDGVTGSFFEENNFEDLLSKINFWVSRKGIAREETRSSAYEIIDTKFNPFNQIAIFKNVLSNS